MAKTAEALTQEVLTQKDFEIVLECGDDIEKIKQHPKEDLLNLAEMGKPAIFDGQKVEEAPLSNIYQYAQSACVTIQQYFEFQQIRTLRHGETVVEFRLNALDEMVEDRLKHPAASRTFSMPSPVQHGPIGPIKEEEEAQPAETADEDIPLDQWIDFLHCSVDTLSRGSALRIRVRRLLPKEKHEENWVYVPGRAQKMILAGQITRARRSLGLALHKISQKPQGGLVVESVGRDVNNCNIWLIKKAETAVPQKRKKRPAKPEVDTLLPPGYIPRGIWDACLMAIHHFYPNGQHFKARDIAKLACSGKIPLELLPSELRDDVKKKEVQGFAQRLGTRFAQTVANLPAVAGHPIVIQHDVGNICTWSVLVCRALAPIRLEDPRVQKMLRHLYTHSPAEGLLSLDIVVMMHGNSSFYASLPQHFQRSLRAKRPTASVGRLLRELAKQSPGSGDFWIESTSKNTSGRNTWKAHFKG